MVKKLKIDMSDLEDAFTMEMDSYLNVETGKVVMVSEDDRCELNRFLNEIDSKKDTTDINAAFESWLENSDCPDWQVDNVRDAFMAENGENNNFILIPRQESRDGYEDMVDFADSVNDERLRELLDVALNGKGAFRRFKDVLINYPEERKRYFEFCNNRQRDRILEWLDSEDIELED